MAPSELAHESLADFTAAIEKLKLLAVQRQTHLDALPTLAQPCPLDGDLSILPRHVPDQGWGLTRAIDFLLDDVAKVLNPGQAGPRYFGFVTGGVLPSALLSDWFTTLYDQNVQVHLPRETFSTVIEAYAVDMVIALLGLDTARFTGTLTTGATTSNLLALACARESTLRHCMQRRGGGSDWSAAEHGLSAALRVRVFVCQAHASVRKTAAIVGIGRANVIDVGRKVDERQEEQDDSQAAVKAVVACLDFDLARLRDELRQCYEQAEPAIVVVGMGEVVTGALTDQTLEIRKLCTEYGAWLHMDAAFSAFNALVDGYQWMSEHMSVCDSITSDGHKALNVPYDCGILLIRKESPGQHASQCLLDEVCGTGRAAAPSYLASTSSISTSIDGADALNELYAIPSPLNRNLENSRRFRALPLYISLLSQGKEGTAVMIERMLRFTARLRSWLESCPYYQVLTPICSPFDAAQSHIPQPWRGDWGTTVIFFRAHPNACPVVAYRHVKTGHLALVQAIKETQKVYCSPGSLNGVGGARIAVSNWATGLNGDVDFETTTAALLQVMEAVAEK